MRNRLQLLHFNGTVSCIRWSFQGSREFWPLYYLFLLVPCHIRLDSIQFRQTFFLLLLQIDIRVIGSQSFRDDFFQLFVNIRIFRVKIQGFRLRTVDERRSITLCLLQKRAIRLNWQWTAFLQNDRLFALQKILSILIGKSFTNCIQRFCKFVILCQVFVRNSICFFINVSKLFRVRLKFIEIVSDYRYTDNCWLNNFVV